MRQTILNIRCDVCGKEIDTKNPVSMGLISLAKIVPELGQSSVIGKVPTLNMTQKMVDINIDLCGECVEAVEQFINTIKKT